MVAFIGHGISRRRRAGGTFPSPARARQGHLPPAQIDPKSPAQRRAEPSPRATVENGVWEEPGGGAVLPLAGQAGGGEKGAKHEIGLPGAQPRPRATPSNTPKEALIGSRSASCLPSGSTSLLHACSAQCLSSLHRSPPCLTREGHICLPATRWTHVFLVLSMSMRWLR
jgi:hypothetical protein